MTGDVNGMIERDWRMIGDRIRSIDGHDQVNRKCLELSYYMGKSDANSV